jgi:hypothetical protein
MVLHMIPHCLARTLIPRSLPEPAWSLSGPASGGGFSLPPLAHGREARGPRRSERARGGTGASRRAQPKESPKDLARPRSGVGEWAPSSQTSPSRSAGRRGGTVVVRPVDDEPVDLDGIGDPGGIRTRVLHLERVSGRGAAKAASRYRVVVETFERNQLTG